MNHTTIRNIIHIDEEKCNGCGLCVKACAEGAIRIVEGKAKLVSEVYCDGLGACLGDCPQGAIKMEQREAKPFDEEAVKQHLAQKTPVFSGCPGLQVRSFAESKGEVAESFPSMLTNWPVQLTLAPVNAPYFNGAQLLLSSDCAPFACGDFHRNFMKGKVLLNACPKLDDASMYVEKLKNIFVGNDLKSVDIVYMEVPCCTGLIRIVEAALEKAGKDLPVKLMKLSLRGELIEVTNL